MIARIWRGVTSAEKAEQYFEYLMETGLKDYRTVPGNRGVQVLRRTYHETFRKTHWGNFQKRQLMAASAINCGLKTSFALSEDEFCASCLSAYPTRVHAEPHAR